MTESQNHFKQTTHSVEETIALGETLGRSLVGGLQIGLVGPLGAGKTQLVKGIAVGNAEGEAPSVTSPTFTLVHEYPGRLRLYHADLYRLEGPAELVALGFEEWLDRESVVVVEWADRARSLFDGNVLWIEFESEAQTSRSLIFTAMGDAARDCLHRLDAVLR